MFETAIQREAKKAQKKGIKLDKQVAFLELVKKGIITHEVADQLLKEEDRQNPIT